MNNSLFHWGIPGMKWGVRRNLTPSSRHLSKAGGKLSIVTKRYGDHKIIRRTPIPTMQPTPRGFVTDKFHIQKHKL